MCGIVGIVDPGLSAAEIRATLQRMTDAIVHRGPDDDGFFAANGVGLGMRRLSIIDVTGGQQPLTNEDGRVQVVFNGEIYNHQDLRARLTAQGHVFQTQSDTEAIAHQYEESDLECFAELRGMFGIAVWDQRLHRLVLARDRLGKKPLYVAHRDGRLLFGSEIKAILAADPSLAAHDFDQILPYLQYGFVPGPRTMFQAIDKLPAASWLTFEDGVVKTGPYWKLPVGATESDGRSADQWAEELDALLQESVKIRLMSEVPLGVFLSGGLDSSAIVAHARRAGAHPLRTFTIGFDRPEWDESPDAEIVARHFGTEHHVLKLSEDDLASDLPETLLALTRHFDEPFADSSAIPTWHVSRLARQHVTVILGGDGGDELFAGYHAHLTMKFAESYRRLPDWLAGTAVPGAARLLAGVLPRRQRYQALRAAKVLHDSSLPFAEMYFSKIMLCQPGLLRTLLQPAYLAGRPIHQTPEAGPDLDAVVRSDLPMLTRASYADIALRLVEDMLVKVDRMSMAHSLEARSPFLDHRLVELAASMPPDVKLPGWDTKAMLKRSLRGTLPASTFRKRKHGFSVPLREWLRGRLDEMVGDYLIGSSSRLPAEVFNRRTVSRLCQEHRAGTADHSPTIWLLLMFAAWSELYQPRAAQEPVLSGSGR